MEDAQNKLEQEVIANQPKPEFTLNTDTVQLPSQGVLYNNKKAEVLIEYMTAVDEDILTAPNLMREGTTFDILLKNKIKDKDVDYKTMLLGDINRILLHLRITGYGADYDVKVTCPETGKEFKETIDLMSLEDMPLSIKPDAKNEFSFKLPMTKRTIKFRYLTYGEEKEIESASTQESTLLGGYKQSLTRKLKAQIMEIDGDRDKLKISQFVDVMPPGDSSKLRRYMTDNEPSVNLIYQFKSPYTGNFFFSTIDTTRLFYPNARI